MTVRGLWTTQVGSLPKPPEILAARADFAKGRISRKDLLKARALNLDAERRRERVLAFSS